MRSDLTRRSFASGLVAAMALPRLALAQSSNETRRFGVFSLFAPQGLLVESTQPLLLHFDRQMILVQPESPATTIRMASGNRLEVTANRDTYLTSNFRVTSVANEAVTFTLAVPPPSLHGTIRRQYTGTLELQRAGSALQPIVIMELEAATASIVQAESPAGATLSYLRAQAIVSRSFLLAADTGHRGFDFCDTTHCQFLREAPPSQAPAAVATRETRSQRLTYNGQPLAAMYSRSCGGHTRTLADLGLPVKGYPYYAVDCELCLHHPERWHRALAPATLTTERERLVHNRIHGWSALPSGVFARSGDGIAGTGVGHGLGLCQRGAAAMAVAGSDHREILSHYYPNTVMA